MIATLLSQIGLPLLAKAVGFGLGKIGHPVADKAADALDAVQDTIAAGAITPEQVSESNRHIEKMAEIDSQTRREVIGHVNATMRAEALSGDRFVRRWRPTFGYAVALAWTAQMGAVTYVVVAAPDAAAQIVAAMGSLSVMWGVALGVLGVSVHQRSKDKALAAASGIGMNADSRGPLGVLVDRLMKTP